MSDAVEDTTRQVAEAFAESLCDEEWFEAGRQLAGAATYALRGRRVLGRRKIMALFRENAEWARETFDAVEFAWEVVDVDGVSARLRFIDRLRLGERTHDHVSEELAEVNPERELIMNLTHVDVPGEDASLREFLR
jgi:hypothetical protein